MKSETPVRVMEVGVRDGAVQYMTWDYTPTVVYHIHSTFNDDVTFNATSILYIETSCSDEMDKLVSDVVQALNSAIAFAQATISENK